MLPARPRRFVVPAFALLALLSLIFTLSFAAVSAGGQTTEQLAQTSQTTGATTFSGAAAKQQVEALAEQIGSRPAGSTNADRGAQYALDQLRQWGYQPTLQTFPVQTYDDRGSELTVTVGGSQRPRADTLVYSLAGDVEAPLVAVPGVGSAEDFAGLDVQGKIALVKRGTLRFSEKVANAAAAGAAGVVIYNDVGGRVQGSLVQQEAVPAVTISGDDGQQLLDLLAAGSVQLRLRVDGSIEHSAANNVVAELPGSRGDSANIVVGAHMDSVPAGPGANDNGSGSGVVLELARTLAQLPSSERPITLRFVLFGAEELGLHGSRYYVSNLSEEERHAIVAMINLDMVGVGSEWRFGGTDDLVQRALGASNDLGARALPMRGPLGSASDHASFLNAGVPAVFFYRTDDPNYHTPNDRAEFVDADALGQAGTMALRVISEVSASPGSIAQ
jgi:Zn-dependent M28 family amino/carboxypeptidase